jgi:hypothetical protein
MNKPMNERENELRKNEKTGEIREDRNYGRQEKNMESKTGSVREKQKNKEEKEGKLKGEEREKVHKKSNSVSADFALSRTVGDLSSEKLRHFEWDCGRSLFREIKAL